MCIRDRDYCLTFNNAAMQLTFTPPWNRIGPTHRLKMPLIRKLFFPVLIILFISITSTFGQNENDHTIYLSGQLTNIQNGAPIKGHTVYIQSNPENYGGY